jgi:hypothetical protein
LHTKDEPPSHRHCCSSSLNNRPPRAEAMSPQGDPTHWLSTLHTQQPQNPGSTPTTVPILQLSLFPTTCTTQGMYPLHFSQSLGLYHSFIRAPSALGWPGNLSWGPSRTLSFPRSSLNSLYQALESLPQQENVLQDYNPFYRHTNLISNITHNLKWFPSSTTWLVLFLALPSPLAAKICL